MKKLILCVIFSGMLIMAGAAGAADRAGWQVSLPGYNMGMSYSYYQPLLGALKGDEIQAFMGMDPVSAHVSARNSAFMVRYSIAPNFQLGLNYNAQDDVWRSSFRTDNGSDTTVISNQWNIATLSSYLPTAVLVYRMPVAKGYFSAGGGVGYYVVNYSAGKDTVTAIDLAGDGTADTITYGRAFSASTWAGNFGTQVFAEFTYPVFRDIFFITAKAGYVFCLISQPVYISDKGGSYTYSLPDIDLSGWLGTIGFNVEF